LDKEIIIREVKNSFSFAHEMSSEQMAWFAQYCTIEEVPAGTVLVERIESCPGLLLIISGVLKVSKTSDDGREITIYRIGKGRTCPLSAICILGDLKGYFARVVAEVRTKILWVSRGFVNKSMVECEPFWRYLLGCMANRLYESIQVVDNIAFIPVKNRLAQILLLNSSYGKHPVYTTHDALARELGTAREVVSRELKNFERAGLLFLARGLITIENVGELEILAAGNNSGNNY
jgi:CRP/FNR family transcriptional regulator